VSEVEKPAAPPPTPKGQPGRAPSGLPWRTIAWIVIAVYAAIFLVRNNDKVQISFVFFEANTRLIWLILLSMGIGALLMLLGPRYARYRREQRDGGKQ
jgi:uncharacterized integral membrane protein